MKIVILCPGPSLNHFLSGERDPDCVYIGVNKAAEAFKCDYWSFGDVAAYQNIKPRRGAKRITIFTGETHAAALRGDPDSQLYDWLTYEAIAKEVPPEVQFRNYSLLAALVLAEWLLRGQAEKRVRIYGADLCGLNYYDGSSCGEVDYRWGNERHWLLGMKVWLMGCGVVVEHECQESPE